MSEASKLVVQSHQASSPSDYLAQQVEFRDNETQHSAVSNSLNLAQFQFRSNDEGNFVTVMSNIQEPSSSSFLGLQGPAGKGEYQLVKLNNPELDIGIGSSTEYTSWFVKTSSESTHRQLGHIGVTEEGHWIAVPANGSGNLSDESIDTWELWWYSPCAANMEDFPAYVMVDLEVINNTVK